MNQHNHRHKNLSTHLPAPPSEKDTPKDKDALVIGLPASHPREEQRGSPRSRVAVRGGHLEQCCHGDKTSPGGAVDAK